MIIIFQTFSQSLVLGVLHSPLTFSLFSFDKSNYHENVPLSYVETRMSLEYEENRGMSPASPDHWEKGMVVFIDGEGLIFT